MIEATVKVPAALGAAAERWAQGLGLWGYAIEDADTGRADEVWLRMWLDVALEPAAVAAALGPAAILTQREVDPASWATPTATPLGRGFCVVPPGGEALTGRIPLYLETGAAFGDGEHPSTALCVGWLEDQPALAGSVLDVGTGTGLLLILAALRGAGPLAATELDPAARAAAGRAFAAHGLAVDLGVALPAGRFAGVLANLPIQALLPLIPDLAARLDAGGRLVLAGFVAGAEPALTEAFAAAGLRRVERREEGGWCLWVGARA